MYEMTQLEGIKFGQAKNMAVHILIKEGKEVNKVNMDALVFKLYALNKALDDEFCQRKESLLNLQQELTTKQGDKEIYG